MTEDPEASAHLEDIDTIRQQAADWIVRLDQGGPEELEQLEAECAAWQATDSRREQVLGQMRRMWSATGPDDKFRRKAGAFGVLALLAASLVTQLPWNVWTADHRTAPEEIREFTLRDGSIVTLDSDSAINVDYSDESRTVVLARGTVLVSVHEDVGRAFRVRTEHGEAAALGTRYTVRLERDHAEVMVHEPVAMVRSASLQGTL